MPTHVADAHPIYDARNPTPFARMSAILGIDLRSHADAVRLARHGVPAAVWRRAADRIGIPDDLVCDQNTPRCGMTDGRLTASESERLLRIVRVYVMAVELFGTETAALEWFQKSADFVSNEPPESPMTLASTDTRAQLIESVLSRTAHGFF